MSFKFDSMSCEFDSLRFDSDSMRLRFDIIRFGSASNAMLQVPFHALRVRFNALPVQSSPLWVHCFKFDNLHALRQAMLDSMRFTHPVLLPFFTRGAAGFLVSPTHINVHYTWSRLVFMWCVCVQLASSSSILSVLVIYIMAGRKKAVVDKIADKLQTLLKSTIVNILNGTIPLSGSSSPHPSSSTSSDLLSEGNSYLYLLWCYNFTVFHCMLIFTDDRAVIAKAHTTRLAKQAMSKSVGRKSCKKAMHVSCRTTVFTCF